MKNEITIDGRQGEGGGQVVRTSLSLAAALRQPVTIENVRGGRRKPGLLRQHRTALWAVRDMTGGEVEGDELGSTRIRFVPGAGCHGGNYHFPIGSAGSTMLVLQTVLPPLLFADAPSTITLEGGTHNPMAPPFEAFRESFLPCLVAMGADVQAELLRPGFFPAGGGSVRVDVKPASAPRPFELTERGTAQPPSVEVLVQNLSDGIGEREWKAFQKRAHWTRDRLTVSTIRGGRGPGNVMLARLPFKNLTTVIASFGMRSVSAELVGAELAGLLKGYSTTDAPVDEYLADQLMLPMALLGGGRYRTGMVSEHAATNRDVINAFLPGAVEIQFEGGQSGRPLRRGTAGPALVSVTKR